VLEPGATHVLHQRIRYDYREPVSDLRHRLVVVPPLRHGGQRRLRHRVTATGARTWLSARRDGFGNHVVDVWSPSVSSALEFEAWTVVAAPAGDGLVHVAPEAHLDPRFLRPSPLTRPDARITDVARSLAGPAGPAGAARGAGLAERICAWVHAALRYQFGVTGVRTGAAEALAAGGGVCQDHAHLMLALCRASGLAARYVSGHLVGEGGSHAWVEVVVPDAGRPSGAVALALDPTHARRAATGYLTVAVGRDYGDVAPTSGTFSGPGPGSLRTSKRLELVSSGSLPPVRA
jgi:transglutaminase-like putative cysteine protease